MNLADDPQASVPVIQRPEYVVSLEQINPTTTFVHVVVSKWSPSIRRRLTDDFDRFYDLHGGPLFTGVRPDDHKLQHFVSLLGGKHVATHTNVTTGRTYLIFKR